MIYTVVVLSVLAFLFTSLIGAVVLVLEEGFTQGRHERRTPEPELVRLCPYDQDAVS